MSARVIALLISFEFIVTIFASAMAFADTKDVVVKASTIYDFPQCAGQKSKITNDQVERLFQKKLFPGPFDALGEFVLRTENWEKRMHAQAFSCTRERFTYSEEQTPKELEIALKNITRETTKLIQRDIQAQRTLLDIGEVCSKKVEEVAKAGQRFANLKLEDFKQLKGQIPSDEECFGFASNFVPALEDKLRTMRIMMVVGEDPEISVGPRDAPWGQRVRHDKPFTQDLVANFFPSVWKKGSLTHLRGLSDEDFKEARALSKKMAPQEAKIQYYQLISNSPILLFFDNEVTPQNLARAYAEMKKQSSRDLENMVEKAPQELMLMIPYVLKALENTPSEKRGDACMVVSQIFRNLNRRYEKFPQMIAQAGLLMSVAGGLGGATVKQFLALTSRYAGWTAMVYGGAMTKDTLGKYSRGVAMCSVSVVENQLCDIESTDQLYRRGQSHAVGGAVSGTLLFGIGRILRPAAP